MIPANYNHTKEQQWLNSIRNHAELCIKHNIQVATSYYTIPFIDIQNIYNLEHLSKVKMSICPECGNVIRVAIEHEMTTKSKNEFAKEVMKYDLQVKTITLTEYRASDIQFYCKDSCSRKTSET